MARCPKIRVLILLLGIGVPSAAFGQDSRSVRLVEITSRRSVTGPTEPRFSKAPHPTAATENNITDLAITKEGDAYQLNGQTVDPHLIALLVGALTAPANPTPNLDDLGVTPAWLKEHAASAAQSVYESMRVGRKHVPQAAMETIFADPAIMNPMVQKLFDPRGHLCADCFRYHLMVTVTITFDGGTQLTAGTSSQTPFMLPWRTDATAYNADISRAVAALMPANSANRALLLSEHFDRQLAAAAVPLAIELDVNRRAAGALDALRTKYIIERASIGEFSDTSLGGPVPRMPEDSTIFFELRRSDAPDIFFGEELTLPFVDGDAVGTDVFLQRAPQYEQLVLSVPWLNEFARRNKGIVRFHLALFHGRSLSDEAAQLFAQDMHAIGRDELRAKTEAAKGQIAVLMVGLKAAQSEWLVFPDHHMVLWRYFRLGAYADKSDLREWQPVSFIKTPCNKTAGGFMGCVGEEISPDGAVIAP